MVKMNNKIINIITDVEFDENGNIIRIGGRVKRCE